MTDSNDTKTTEQLLAEIEALKEQLAARGSDSDKSVSARSSQPIFEVPITRRQALQHALVGWVSPVILSVPLATVLLTKPGTAYAATRRPTMTPTLAPPTAAPTLATTVAPTAVSIPGPGLIGIAALGSALAAAGSKLVMDRMGATGADGSKSSAGSGDDSGSK